ncbi:class I SAM-dependent methyltransferase [Falsiroseomonas sp.]|uniref:class I SAM-dependent methyltransferase n=1 Tax=Falsiroseomonas sp. TaxID=2870721 RepID=UPI00356829D8
MSDRPRPLGWFERRPERPQVVAAYRYLLGREPESEAVIAAHLAAASTNRDLRNRFLASAECRAQFDPARWRPMELDLPPADVETEAGEGALQALLARTGRAWTGLGEAGAHWSVVTDDRFRPDRLAENLAAFEATGAEACRVALAMLARHGIAPAALPHCLEFGCGVGRITLPLSRHFARVTGCDISDPHLGFAREAAEIAGRGNIAWWHATPEAPLPAPPWDLWFSQLVLQHNPPPVSREVLRRAFAGLAPGGVALFQLLTHIRGYRFSMADYLARPPAAGMEMHALPQVEVFRLAAEAGLAVLEVREDSHQATREAGRYLSHSFVLRRPG